MDQSDLVGFEPEWKVIKDLITRRCLPHAILLNGRRSIGKIKFAKKIAVNFFISKYGDSSHTTSAKDFEELVNSSSFPDLINVKEDEDKNIISVEQIRAVIEKLSLKSYYNMGVVCIIDDVEKLTVSAANSLLKILEEPEKDKLFILITSQPQKVMETVLSRTQSFYCAPRTPIELKEILARLAPNMNKDRLDRFVEKMDGSLELIGGKGNDDDQTKYIHERITFLEETSKRIENILGFDDPLIKKSQFIQFIRSAEKDLKTKNFYLNTIISSIRERMKKREEDEYFLSELILNLIKSTKDIHNRNLDFETQLSRYF